MSSIVEERRLRRGHGGAFAIAARLRPVLPLFAVVIAAVLVRLWIVTATDVSWLITLSEKVLDGARLYVDLIEVNPPASVWLYLPAVALARAIGIAPEIVVNAFVFLAVGASLCIAGWIFSRARLLDDIDGWTLAAFAVFLLLVFPARTFAQREHIAVIVLMPVLAVYVARARGLAPGFAAAIVAGIGAGIAVSIKPHFALAVAFAAAAAAFYAKSWRPLLAPEHWIAALIVAAYGASILVFYPQFITDVLPLVQAVYVPVRRSLWAILAHTSVILWLLSIFLLARQRRGALFEPRLSILLAASCGFALAYALQGKGWPYHTYPMLVLAFGALAVLLCERASKQTRIGKLGLFAASLGLVAAGFYAMSLAVDFTPLARSIRESAIRPKVLAISPDIGLGHPLVRQVGGRWVQRVGCLWITNNAEWLLKSETSLAAAARLQNYAAFDRALLLEDIRREKPDIILLDAAWEARTRANPALSALLGVYAETGREAGVIVLRRQGP
ncbi:MAG TPA: hypothetical protein VEH75_06880 [Xanthobacteraceae bacterium]|nr:hypothetical protein [Xanthobacteraceae bacterium]